MARHGLTRSEISKQSRQRRQRSERNKRLLWTVLVLILVVVGLATLRLERFSIQEIQVRGVEASNSTLIKTQVESGLSGSYAFLLPRRHLWFWPQSALERGLASNFAAIGAVSLERQGQTVVVQVSERVAQYLWCGTLDTNCYLLDRSGLAFAAAPSFSGRPFFELISELPANPVGARPLAPERFASLLAIRDTLEAIVPTSVLGGTIPAVRLETLGDLSFRLQPAGALPPVRLSLNPDLEPEQISADLSAALNAEAFVTEYQASVAAGTPLAYLDYHFPGRIFYKFSASQ